MRRAFPVRGKIAPMDVPTEIEVKFQVTRPMRARVAQEVARGEAERTTLSAMYLDTPGRHLARAGLAWRMRREGRRWVQTLKQNGRNVLERFEHEVVCPDARFDAARHAGTPAGDRLLALLRKARKDGGAAEVRYRTEVRRTARRLRTRGAVVEVAYDEGRLVAQDAVQRIAEIEFELVSGSPAAMLELAQRWQDRYALVYDPRSKAERGDGLADGAPHPPVRKGGRPDYARDATAAEAFGAVLDECLGQVARNAVGLHDGDPAHRVEHVHQMRVGIRRLRSALRSFRGWVAQPPPALVDGLRSVFATLGRVRDSDVLGGGVAAELAKAGAPAITPPAAEDAPDAAEVARAPQTQGTLLAWMAWRTGLGETEMQAAADGTNAAPQDLRRSAQRRLRRWHGRIVADWQAFDELDEPRLHALRKRIKRQRYATEFFAAVLRRRDVERYMSVLSDVQERMGELNDLFVARGQYQRIVASDPSAWFALGWLTARIAQVRALAGLELERLAKTDPPAK
jgi:inorganic triphosphatase YgiF